MLKCNDKMVNYQKEKHVLHFEYAKAYILSSSLYIYALRQVYKTYLHDYHCHNHKTSVCYLPLDFR